MAVQTFRKKPIDVRAVQFTGDNLDELEEFAPGNIRVGCSDEDCHCRDKRYEVFDKLHDTWIKFTNGQWILEGTEGENYPHDDAPFRKNYELVKDGSPTPSSTVVDAMRAAGWSERQIGRAMDARYV